jgi:hypothetical protein
MDIIRDRIFINIGYFITSSQVIDSLLKSIVSFVIPDKITSNMNDIELIDSKLGRHTMGQLIHELKKRVDFHESIETVVDRFLKNRNNLVHNFRKIEGSQLESPKDIELISMFLDTLLDDQIIIMNFLMALLLSWTKQVGLNSDFFTKYDNIEFAEWYQQIIKMESVVDSLIFQKHL